MRHIYVFFALIFHFFNHRCALGRLTVAKTVVYTDGFLISDRMTPLNPGKIGTLTFEQDTENSEVRISGKLIGLTPGRHGFHIHELGNLENGCNGAAGHFNPTNSKHGPTWTRERHIGDLGNIAAFFDTTSIVHIQDSRIQLSGKNSIIGRAVVIHEQEDDLGLGGDISSLTTGNSGRRIACGVIGIASIDYDPEEISTVNVISSDETAPAGFETTLKLFENTKPIISSRPVDAVIIGRGQLFGKQLAAEPRGIRLHLTDRLKDKIRLAALPNSEPVVVADITPLEQNNSTTSKDNNESEADFYGISSQKQSEEKLNFGDRIRAENKLREEIRKAQKFYNCFKVPYKAVCESGIQSQFTLRYFYDKVEKRCRLYPWGYCIGEHDVGNDPAIRYLEKCKEVCNNGN